MIISLQCTTLRRRQDEGIKQSEGEEAGCETSCRNKGHPKRDIQRFIQL